MDVLAQTIDLVDVVLLKLRGDMDSEVEVLMAIQMIDLVVVFRRYIVVKVLEMVSQLMDVVVEVLMAILLAIDLVVILFHMIGTVEVLYLQFFAFSFFLDLHWGSKTWGTCSI